MMPLRVLKEGCENPENLKRFISILYEGKLLKDNEKCQNLILE